MRTIGVSVPGMVRICSSAAAFALGALLVPLPVQGEEPSQKPGAVLRGRLVLEGSGRQSDWRILAGERLLAELPRDAAGRPMGTTPNADGTFALRVTDAGVVYVCPYIGGRLAADNVAPARVTADEEREQELTLRPKPPREGVAFVLQRDDGKPLDRKVKVHLCNMYGEVDGSTGGTWSDEAGVVRFQRLPCTRYDLWVEGPAEAATDGDGLAAVLFRGLDVIPDEGTQTMELTVPQAGSVKGRLLQADGNTPAQKHVVAVRSATIPDEDAGPDRSTAGYARGARSCYAEAEVAADGTFVLRGLTPGQHSLDIRRPGQREAWCTIRGVEVTAGQMTDLGSIEVARDGWEHMFNRRTLGGWRESDFYGQKEVRIENDRIVLTEGRDMTGITWTRQIPRVDYEVTLEAMRVAEDDFFCGLTFPVKDDYCSLILGGWGGSVVGLSSLDGYDASENETSDWIQFDNRRWYRVRLRVTQSKIEAWLDEDNIVDVATKNRHISTRIEVEPSKPFGIATWCTTGAVRDIRIRSLDAPAP